MGSFNNIGVLLGHRTSSFTPYKSYRDLISSFFQWAGNQLQLVYRTGPSNTFSVKFDIAATLHINANQIRGISVTRCFSASLQKMNEQFHVMDFKLVAEEYLIITLHNVLLQSNHHPVARNGIILAIIGVNNAKSRTSLYSVGRGLDTGQMYFESFTLPLNMKKTVLRMAICLLNAQPIWNSKNVRRSPREKEKGESKLLS